MPRKKAAQAPQRTEPGDFPLPLRVDFAQPLRITNSTTTEPYTTPRWNVRAGGDDHKQYRSRGF